MKNPNQKYLLVDTSKLEDLQILGATLVIGKRNKVIVNTNKGKKVLFGKDLTEK